MTKVVNIYKETYDEYIGRAGKGLSGYFGNLHKVGYCNLCNEYHTREEAIQKYKEYFYNRIENDLEFKYRVMALKDKILG